MWREVVPVVEMRAEGKQVDGENAGREGRGTDIGPDMANDF
jgi:hypothetical protein